PVAGVLVKVAQGFGTRPVGRPVLKVRRKVGERHQGTQGRDQLVLRNRKGGAETAVGVLAAQQIAKGLGIRHRVRVVRLSQAGDESGVVGGGRNRPLLERRQQLVGGGWQRQRRRPGQYSVVGVDVVDFRSRDPLEWRSIERLG